MSAACAPAASGSKAGIFRNGLWVLDYNRNGVWDGGATDPIISLGQAVDVPNVGGWNDSGTDKVGIFRSGRWGEAAGSAR